MLKAYIDDSGRGQTTGDYLDAGFVAPVENWLVFNHAWKNVLDIPPALDYWHTLDAMARVPTELFRGWTREECDARLFQLLGVIHSCILIRIRVSIPHDFYKTAFKRKVAPNFDNPFFLPAYSIMQLTLRALAQNGVTEKVDFIFDKPSGTREERFITDAWEMFWAQMDRWPDEYAPMKRILGDPVQFKDDKEVLPLQAADLYAWFARQHGEHRSQGGAYDHLAWKSLCAVPGPTREWTEAELTNVVRQVHEHVKENNLTLKYDLETDRRNPRKRKKR